MQIVASEEPFETAEDERVDDLSDPNNPDDTAVEENDEDEALAERYCTNFVLRP